MQLAQRGCAIDAADFADHLAATMTRHHDEVDTDPGAHGGVRAPSPLRGVLGLVVEHQKLLFRQRQVRIGPPQVIGEFDFKHTRYEGFYDGADLAAEQPVLG
jgi:hypothetical protein